MTWAYLIVMVVVLILGIALAPKAQGPAAAEIDDFDFPTAEEGRPIPVVFGEVDIRGSNILWYGDLRVQAIKKRSGFSKSTVGHKYYIGWHAGLCHGPVDAITNILVGEKQAWSGNVTSNSTISINLPDLFGGEKREGGISGAVDVCMGGPAQTANSYLSTKLASAYPGIPVTAFRGITCIVAKGMYIGTSAYPKVWAVRTRRILEGWQDDITWYDTKAVVDTRHMNPAHIIYQCLTDNRWGMGVDFSLIDETSFEAVADQLHTENFGMSVIWNQSESIEKFIQIILDHVAGGLTLNNSTGKYELLLVRGDYDVETLEIYDESEIVRVNDYQRQGWGETVNEVTLVYTDPVTRKDTTRSQQDLANIDAQGARIPAIIKLKGIHNHDVARTVLARELVSRVTPLSKVVFEINRRAWATRYGGLFKLVYSPRGINGTVYRVLKVSKGTITKNTIKIEALEDIYALGVNSSIANPSDPPGDEDPPDTPADAVDTGVNVISSSQVTPPTTPADGDSYFIPGDGTATGVWAGHEGQVADYDLETDEWIFTDVPDNTLIFDESTNSWQTVVGGVPEAAPWPDAGSTFLTATDQTATMPNSRRLVAGDNILLDNGTPGQIIIHGEAGGGGGGGLGSLVYVDVSNPGANTIANTTTETAFSSSYTFTLAHLDVGTVIRVKATGVYSTDASPPTLRIRVKLGSVTVLDTTAFTTTASLTNRGWALQGEAVIQTAGLSGEIEAQGVGLFSTGAVTANMVHLTNTAYVSADLSASRQLTLTAQWGTASANNTIKMRQLIINEEIIEVGAVAAPVALLHFEDTDGSVIFTDVQRKQWVPAGNAQIDTAQFKFGASSLALDGTGDWVTSMPDEDFAFGAGDFCIEGFVRWTSSFSSNRFAFCWGAGWALYTFGGTIAIFDGASSNVIIGGSLSLDTWYHVAVSREGTNLRLFVDGVQAGSTATNSTNHTAAKIRLGASLTGTNLMQGWIDEVRIHKGEAVYTANFTAPSAAFSNPTPVKPEVTLLHFEGADGSTTFTDSIGGKTWTVTSGSPAIDTAQFKFGSASLEDPASTAYISTPSHADFGYGTENFTIEFWYRPSSFPGIAGIYDQRSSLSQPRPTLYHPSGSGTLNYFVNGAAPITGSTALSTGTWYHIAVCRFGTNTKLFINGTQEGSTWTADTTNYEASQVVLGTLGDSPGSGGTIGHFDELRVTKGHARYLENFDVPNAPFPD